MAENSKIEWTDHTFNPWIGCTKVSPGCANCYAETLMDKRLGHVNWGKGNPRKRTSPANWQKVYSWNAARTFLRKPSRQRVFVASLSDWLDPEVPAEWLADLLNLVMSCRYLDFLMLTKRPELFKDRIEAAFCSIEPAFDQYTPMEEREDWEKSDAGKLHRWLVEWKHGVSIPENVWVGTSVEDQKRCDERVPELIKIPAKVRFLSCEPLLGPVHLEPYLLSSHDKMAHETQYVGPCDDTDKVHWVIAGGESGPAARPMHPDWLRSLRDQCDEWSTPFFFKQWGEWASVSEVEGEGRFHKFEDGATVRRVGKKAAGRLLGGKEYSEFPVVERIENK